jgi:hypothetical protein
MGVADRPGIAVARRPERALSAAGLLGVRIIGMSLRGVGNQAAALERRLSRMLWARSLRLLLPLLRELAPARLPQVAASALGRGEQDLARRAAQLALTHNPCVGEALRVLLALAPARGAASRDALVALFTKRCPALGAALHLEASRLACASGAYAQALAHCRRGLAFDADPIDCLDLMVRQAYLVGDADAVLGVLQDVAGSQACAPLPVETLLDAALMAEEAGDIERARALLELAAGRSAAPPRVLDRRLLLDARHLPLDDLRAELAGWLARGGRHADAARSLAVLLAYYQDRDDARVLALAAAAPPGVRAVRVHAALAHARRGERRQALAALAGAGAQACAELAAARAEICRMTADAAGQVAALNAWNAWHAVAPVRALAVAGDLRLPVAAAPVAPEPEGPLVSVIMPVYKAGPLLDMAVASLLAQSYAKLEVLLVDDASPDDTAERLARWQVADARVRLLRMPRNGGPYLAKNAALVECTGELIGFADSDDWNHPQRIARQVRMLAERPDAEAVCVRYVRVDADGHIIFRRTAVKTAWQTLLLRRRALAALGFFMPLRAGADTEFVERIQARFGAAAVLVDPAVTLLAQYQASTLTGGGALAMTWRPVGGARQAHHLAFRRWHRRQLALGGSLYVPHPLPAPPYPVPQVLRV